MAKYYNEYQPLRPSKGFITLLVIIAVVLAAAIALTVAFVIVPKIREQREGQTDIGTIIEEPEENDEETLTPLSAPYDLSIDITQTKLSWKCADSVHAVSYRIKINGVEQSVYTNPVTVNFVEEIDSQIYVKAIGDNNTYSDSVWSAVLTVHKDNADLIAYNIASASIQSILQSRVNVEGTAITVNQIFTIDYRDLSARVWYSYSAGGVEGHACTTIIMPNVSGVLDYKNKQSQIEAVINNNNIITDAMEFVSDDVTTALLARTDLTGSLANYKNQSAVLTPICSYISQVTIAGGEAQIFFRGVIRRERANNVVNYYSYNYTAFTPEVTGNTEQDYLDAISDSAVAFTFTETDAIEIVGLGQEMLILGEQHS